MFGDYQEFIRQMRASLPPKVLRTYLAYLQHKKLKSISKSETPIKALLLSEKTVETKGTKQIQQVPVISPKLVESQVIRIETRPQTRQETRLELRPQPRLEPRFEKCRYDQEKMECQRSKDHYDLNRKRSPFKPHISIIQRLKQRNNSRLHPSQ